MNLGTVLMLMTSAYSWGKQPGHWSHLVFVIERYTIITQVVTGWGEICCNTRSSPVVLQSTLKVRSYVSKILTSVVLPKLSFLPGANYRQDNVSRLSQQYVQRYDVYFHSLPDHQTSGL
ncbi:hypothetical protein TNCV_1889231 [Trichonephila clavipes]|nr:hypothetical protein TNCV_1889231 [Trichonephila clavipes]